MLVNFSELLGKTLVSVTVNNDKDTVEFVTAEGETYIMRHDQDCCESVYIEDIAGELDSLIGSPILMANEAFSSDHTPDELKSHLTEYANDSYTWTFYKLATMTGYATIRWFGSSNGYYGETASLYKVSE